MYLSVFVPGTIKVKGLLAARQIHWGYRCSDMPFAPPPRPHFFLITCKMLKAVALPPRLAASSVKLTKNPVMVNSASFAVLRSLSSAIFNRIYVTDIGKEEITVVKWRRHGYECCMSRCTPSFVSTQLPPPSRFLVLPQRF